MFKNKKIRNGLIVALTVATIIRLVLQVISPAGASASAVNTEGKVVALEVAETIEATGSLEAQSSTTLTWGTGGTGLGLAIAKQLVEAQGGTIEAGNLPEGSLQVVIELKK